MFDFIKRLFGEGKIRAEVFFKDGSSAIIRVPYIGSIDTLDAGEFRAEIGQRMFVDHGRIVTNVNILGWY